MGTKRGDSGDLDKFREKGRSWMGQREKNWAEKERDDGRSGPESPTVPGLPLPGTFSK